MHDKFKHALYQSKLPTPCDNQMQGIPNPCPRVKHPDWLAKKIAALSSRCHQTSLKDMLPRLAARPAAAARKPAAGMAMHVWYDNLALSMKSLLVEQKQPNHACNYTCAYLLRFIPHCGPTCR